VRTHVSVNKIAEGYSTGRAFLSNHIYQLSFSFVASWTGCLGEKHPANRTTTARIIYLNCLRSGCGFRFCLDEEHAKYRLWRRSVNLMGYKDFQIRTVSQSLPPACGNHANRPTLIRGYYAICTLYGTRIGTRRLGDSWLAGRGGTAKPVGANSLNRLLDS